MNHRRRAAREDDARRSVWALFAQARALALVNFNDVCRLSSALRALLGFLEPLPDANLIASLNASDADTPRRRAKSSSFRTVLASR